jgi:peroxiredoxin Q/BCP
MKRLFISLGFALVAASAHAELKPGAAAPAFTIDASQGGKDFSFSLKDALAKGPVVLYFYPKSFTSVCTEEAHEFAEAMPQFAAMGASVIGVSGDNIETQREFSAKECRDKFPVGADPRFKVIKAYEASFDLPLAGAMFASRISYVISPEGKILSSTSDSGATRHIQNALETVRKWRDGAK